METIDSESILIGEIELTEAKRIRTILQSRGVFVELRSQADSCSSKNCKPSVEVYAAPGDIDAIKTFFQEEQDKALEGLSFGAERHSVFDPTQAEATCPACGTVFSTDKTECPDCGLCFGAG